MINKIIWLIENLNWKKTLYQLEYKRIMWPLIYGYEITDLVFLIMLRFKPN